MKAKSKDELNKVSKSNSTSKRTNKKDEKITKKSSNTISKSTVKENNKAKKAEATKTNKAAATKRKDKISQTVVNKNSSTNIEEYYDLPYSYNKTMVKILAQTPTTLFIYWDISEDDKKDFIAKYGENFFNETKPVLIITNKTLNYTFEIEINDFANSWYLHLNDADCDYSVELGRRPITPKQNMDSYIFVSASNHMEMPNNHILFDKLGSSVFFKNIKNNISEKKDILSLSFIKNLGQVYDIYEFYKEIYKDEINIEDLSQINLSSSSSSNFM